MCSPSNSVAPADAGLGARQCNWLQNVSGGRAVSSPHDPCGACLAPVPGARSLVMALRWQVLGDCLACPV